MRLRLVAALGGIALLIGFLLVRSHLRRATAVQALAVDGASGGDRTLAQETTRESAPADQESDHRVAVPTQHLGGDDAEKASADEAARAGESKKEGVSRQLSAAIEQSTFGVLDPAAILDASLSLVNLKVDQRDLPGVAPGGELRYPLLDPPAGVKSAELWVARPSNPKLGNVLSLKVQLDPPPKPYIVGNALRQPPELEVTAYYDKSGNLSDLDMLTVLRPSGETGKWGMPLSDGIVPEGVHYHLGLGEPSQWQAVAFGYDKGVPVDLKQPVALEGEPWPNQEALQYFSNGLLEHYNALKQH